MEKPDIRAQIDAFEAQLRRTEPGKNGYLSTAQTRAVTRFNRRIAAQLESTPRGAYLTQMRDPANVVEFEDLHTYFFTDAGIARAVNGVSFDVPQGKTVGIVGESGCGKSVTSLSLMQLLPRPQGRIVDGVIRLNAGEGQAYDITKTPTAVMEELRGRRMAMIFQEPMTSLNPVLRIGTQLDEILRRHGAAAGEEAARRRSVELLEMVGIANARGVYGMYPHELSGGMRQRVMIAMALSCDPRLIIADEPTTALDVTIQAQILELLREMRERTGAGIMLITHDLGVVAGMADFVVVMYAGRVVEKGTVKEIFASPAHPYTVGLMKSKPVPGKRVEELYAIPGKVPNPIRMPQHCSFRDRCERCTEICGETYPALRRLSDTHMVACHRYKDREGGKAL